MSIRYYVMRVSVDPSRNVDEANFGQSSVIDLDNPTNAATVGGVASFNLPTANGIEVFAHVMDAQLAQSYIENARKITRSFLLEKGRIHLNPNASASQKNAVGYWINQAWEGFFSYFSAANVCARSWEKLRKVLEYNWLTQPSEQNNFLPGCFFYRQENSSRAGLLSTLGEVRCDFSMKKYMGIQNGLWRSMIFKSIREQNLLGGRNNVTRIRFGADENYRLGAWTNRLRPQQFTECPASHCDSNVTPNGYVDNRIWDYASAGIDAGAGTTPIAPTGDFHPIFVNYTNRVCSSILKDSRQYNTSSGEWKFETKPQITELFNDGGPQRYFRSDSQVRFPQIDQEAIPFITTGYVGYRANPWEDDSPTAYCWVPLIWYYDLLFSPIPGLTLNGSNDDIYSPSAITAAAGGTRFLSLAEYLEQKGVEKIVQEIRRDCMFANMKIKAYFRWTDEEIATKMFGGEREIMRSQLDIYRQQNAPLNVISAINSSLRGQNNSTNTNTNPVSAGLAIIAGAAEIVMRTIDFFNKASAASSLRNQWQRDVFGQPLCADVNIGQTTPPIDSQYVPSVRSFKPLYLSSYSPEEFENIIRELVLPNEILSPYEDGSTQTSPPANSPVNPESNPGVAENIQESQIPVSRLTLLRPQGTEEVNVILNGNIVSNNSASLLTGQINRIEFLFRTIKFSEQQIPSPAEGRGVEITVPIPPPSIVQQENRQRENKDETIPILLTIGIIGTIGYILMDKKSNSSKV